MRRLTEITITLADIVKEVAEKTWLAGESRAKDGEGYNIETNSDDANEPMVVKFALNALDNVALILNGYNATIASTASDEYSSGAEDTITLSFRLPANFDFTLTQTLATEIHHFVIDWCLIQWYSTVKPDEITIFQNDLEIVRQKLVLLINKRQKPIR
jgi:hypothetical protein